MLQCSSIAGVDPRRVVGRLAAVGSIQEGLAAVVDTLACLVVDILVVGDSQVVEVDTVAATDLGSGRNSPAVDLLAVE